MNIYIAVVLSFIVGAFVGVYVFRKLVVLGARALIKKAGFEDKQVIDVLIKLIAARET